MDLLNFNKTQLSGLDQYYIEVLENTVFIYVSQYYQIVLFIVLLQCMTYYVIGSSVGQSYKSKALAADGPDGLMAKFGAEHEQAFPGAKLYDGGWPDMGSGKYTKAAGYKHWMEINKG